MEHYDILVAGAGVSGICAAIQAGRLLGNNKVCLVEKNGLTGGTATVAGVNYPGIFHAWGKQVIKGIGWELIEKTYEAWGRTIPDHYYSNDDSIPHWKMHVRIDAMLFAAITDQELADAGVKLKLHTMPGKVQFNGDHYVVTLCGKDGLYDVKANYLIDCTGDANLAFLAGAKLNTPEVCQPGTISCYAIGYEPATLDWKEIETNFYKEVENGNLQLDDFGWGKAFSRGFIGSRGNNATHINDINAFNSENRTKIELAGRACLLRIFKFLKKQKGFENLEFKPLGGECGVRETRTIQGLYEITVEDYVKAVEFEDAICHSFYPIDLHDKEKGLDFKKLDKGKVPQVPLRSLIPKNIPQFLAAGRIISSDRLANSALRVQATCMATGQAAAVAATLAIKTKTQPQKLPLQDIKNTLRQFNAIVP